MSDLALWWSAVGSGYRVSLKTPARFDDEIWVETKSSMHRDPFVGWHETSACLGAYP